MPTGEQMKIELDTEIDERRGLAIAFKAEQILREYSGPMREAWRSLDRSFRRFAGQSEVEVMRAVPLEAPEVKQ